LGLSPQSGSAPGGLHLGFRLGGCAHVSTRAFQLADRLRAGAGPTGANPAGSAAILCTGGLDVIRKEAWPFYRTRSGVRLRFVLEEPTGHEGAPPGEGKLGWLTVVLRTKCSTSASADLVASSRSTPCSPHITKNPTLNLTVNEKALFLHRPCTCTWRAQALGASQLWCARAFHKCSARETRQGER
jgi:hypothetical protein